MSIILTPVALQRVKSELAHIERIDLPHAKENLKRLRKFYGEGSLEPEYIEALRTTKLFHKRINELKDIIKTARILFTTCLN
ncbi:hypothetical protein PP175_29350 (plasmid) [Aneurinibacillus sp. Ricciae_BoGa-3]|uniref:hypothetical protein n=1 Tax=Aneurinibacillus sp. Ricciae_BoGa-3 TaxID=3022697 RepID=UPI002341DEA3|nr:hypothetical protein [Aneurinibacillus sp. Ricciae_BoGa-3]WCK57299.1 hypothetical protein PP175_29350 [Aneurinibacillus sp. Ricciae_BoGa-3]